MKNIKLITNFNILYEDQIWIKNIMYNEPGIKEIFGNKKDRFIASNVRCLIKKGNESIGFLNLVRENISGILFVDIGIIEKYRGLGYAKEAIIELLERYNGEEYIIAEIKNDNKIAINSIKDIGILIYKNDDISYYFLGKEKEDEFKSSKEYQKLLNYKSSR